MNILLLLWIKRILEEEHVEQFVSDTDPDLIRLDYIEIKFIRAIKRDNKTDFTEKVDGENEVLETVDEFGGRSFHTFT